MNRSRWRAGLALALALGLTAAVAACGSDDSSSKADDTTSTTVAEGSTIRLVPQDFAESETLTEVYGQYLEAKGFDVEIQKPNGFRKQVYPALEQGKADLLIDYAGSAIGYLDPTKARTADADKTHADLTPLLTAQGLVALDDSPAADANALVALKSYATEKGLSTISDLAKLGGTVKLVGAEDCRERTDCLKGYTDPAEYGLKIDFTAADYGPALVTALDSGDAQVAQYQTTAPDIASGKIVVLTDDKGLLSSDNVVPILRKAIADEYGAKLADAINALSAKLTTADLQKWNVSTDVQKEEPADVAKAWLESSGLL